MVLGLGDGAGGGEGGGVGGGNDLEQRHRWLWKDNEVISTAWKCLLLRQISMFGGAFEQEGAGKNGGSGEEGGAFLTGLCRIYVGARYSRGARSRRSCGWWGRRGRLGGGGD